MTIKIEGVGVVGGFGTGVDALANACQTRDTKPSKVPVSSDLKNLEAYAYLAETTLLSEFVAKGVLRRVTHFSRLALLGARLALKDAGLANEEMKDMGIIVATAYGDSTTNFKFLDYVQDYGDLGVSPLYFTNSVHNSAASNISIQLGIKGPCATISQQELSVASALLTAKRWLDEGRVKKVLFGSVDEYHPVVGYCFKRYFGECSKVIEPMDFKRQTAVPGEGSAFFVLSNEASDASSKYQMRIKNVILGRDKGNNILIDKNGVLVVGADGHKNKGENYHKYLSKAHTVSANSPLYGTIPISQGFDIAISSLTQNVSCDSYQLLKFDCSSCYGLIEMQEGN